jgi:hypothetical protein
MNKPAIFTSPRHTRPVTTMVNGKRVMSLETVNCALAEYELQQLRLLKDEVARLRHENANFVRLIGGAMQIVFRMGPALQKLLSEALDAPQLTDDQSAVRLEGLLFTVIINPYTEVITVRDISNQVPERSFQVPDGRLDQDSQTLLLGHVQRIKEASRDNGADPVTEPISLVAMIN